MKEERTGEEKDKDKVGDRKNNLIIIYSFILCSFHIT